MSTKRLFALLILIPVNTAAAPGGADLLRACEQSLDGGFHGVAGQMCEYYVTPCDCEAGLSEDVPRVCLPDDVVTTVLARKVISGLQAEPSLQRRAAADAAALILARDYPCTD